MKGKNLGLVGSLGYWCGCEEALKMIKEQLDEMAKKEHSMHKEPPAPPEPLPDVIRPEVFFWVDDGEVVLARG